MMGFLKIVRRGYYREKGRRQMDQPLRQRQIKAGFGTRILLFSLCVSFSFVGNMPEVFAQETEQAKVTEAAENQQEVVPTEAVNQQEVVPTQAAQGQPAESTLYAKSAVLMDAESGRVLYEKNGYQHMPNASTTKIMTCIFALEQRN